MPESHLIQKAYTLTENSDTQDESLFRTKVDELGLFNKANKGTDFLIPLAFYSDILDDANEVFFRFMPDAQQYQLFRDLQVTYLLLLAETRYERNHQKTENAKKYDEQVKKCQKLLDVLSYLKQCQEQKIKPDPQYGCGSEDRPVAYLGLAVGQLLAEQMVEMSDSTTKATRGFMGAINEKRLYWVWTSAFLKMFIDLFPDDFFNAEQAKQTIRYPDPYTGTMSWGLYYCRFALNLGLLLKHTISGPWMSEVEKSEPWTERFTTQWNHRKFALLNDSVWATGNLLCFFWLVGKGVAGTWGDMLTIGLLLFDIALVTWEYAEQSTQHNKQIRDYDKAIKQVEEQSALITVAKERLKKALAEKELLEEAITETELLERAVAEENVNKARQQLREALDALAQKESNKEHTLALEAQQEKAEDLVKKADSQLIELNLQRLALQRARTTCAREWNHQKMNLALNIAYAVGLMLAFVLLAAPFFPLPAATIAAITLSGAILCFTLSVITNAIKGGLEVHKTKKTVEELKEERAEKIHAFNQSMSSGADENAKKLMFLEIKKLMVETEYQEQIITRQTMHLMRSIFIESLIPAVVFVSLMFLPLGTGIGVIAAAITLAVTAHFLINAFFKAEKEEIKEFNKEEYHEFCKNPDTWQYKPLKSPSVSVFQQTVKTTSTTQMASEKPSSEDETGLSYSPGQ